SRESARIGTVLAKLTTPSGSGELVSWRTSQLRAIDWIHEPMFETKAPTQNRRKSRPRRALSMVKEPGVRCQESGGQDSGSWLLTPGSWIRRAPVETSSPDS